MIDPTVYINGDADYIKHDLKRKASSATRLAGKAFRRLRRIYRKLFQNRNYIFVHRGPFEPVSEKVCRFFRYDRFEHVPEPVKEAIVFYSGQEALTMDRIEVEQTAVMWTAVHDQQLTGVLFTRRGKDFKRWFVELRNDDIVIFRVRTYPEFRGRGIAPSLMRYAMQSSLHQGDHAYIDCPVYNTPSIRAIQKAGFEWIATMKPISKEKALGGGR